MTMQTKTDVLIVGAGPVGLSLAIELGLRGVKVVVVERNARTGAAPRAKTTNVRTRTHLRRWGIADKLAEASPFGVDYPNDMVFVTRLTGDRLAIFKDAFNAAPAKSDDYPEHAQWIPQYTLEKVLLDHAASLETVDLRFGTRFAAAVQDASGVTATIESEAGEPTSVRARYLVGADGARSAVRELIGAKLEGQYGLSRHSNIIFRAPGLAEAHGHGPAVVYWQIGVNGVSAIGPMDKDDVWFFGSGGLAEGETLSNAAAAALIVERTGVDLRYEILSADTWVASELLADTYREGRILLAGDAAHLHPPFGGYGMNMGIGDAVDLGWKIAAVLQGWGGPGLIDSYEAERRPVHKVVLEEAMANHAIVGAGFPPTLEDATPEGEAIRSRIGAMIQATKAREFHTLGTVLGLGYETSPIVVADGAPAPVRDGQTYRPSARPGQLAPHAWLDDGRSLYDAFGPGFTLVAGEGASDADLARAEEEARSLGIPLTVIRPAGVPVRPLYEADLALIRPDQHVAWRGDVWASVLGRVTGRDQDRAAA
jgi:2-polyprenyl-6-methoxyphenol hydroxylase-like FAD-dependent oxidoreductase